MTTKSFDCPNCGAPLDYHKSDASTFRCPFCGTSVVIPDELRPTSQPPEKPIIIISAENQSNLPTRKRNSWVFFSVFGAVIIFIVILIVSINGIQRANHSINEAAFQSMTQTSVVSPTAIEPSQVPTPFPTPSFAETILTFGENGIGPGMLNDARYLGIDGDGTIYVADYEGGRIQAFDSSGKYLYQWKIGDAQTIISGMAVSHNGDVYIAYDAYLQQVDGKTGKILKTLTSGDQGEFGDLAVSNDGFLFATWYEGRWGLITSLEGHREDLIIFNPDGDIKLRMPSFISNQTGTLALDNYPTVDGLGNIYILSDELVYKFSPDGKYIDRFGSSGNLPGQFQFPRSITVDGQGRVYIGDSHIVHVFSIDGQYLTDFPTDISAEVMAFDEKGSLWILSNDKVMKYVLTGK